MKQAFTLIILTLLCACAVAAQGPVAGEPAEAARLNNFICSDRGAD